MSRDLLVIVPSRGRPSAVAALAAAITRTRTAKTDLIVAYDDDDPTAVLYEKQRAASRDRRFLWTSGPRDTLTGWTNKLALQYAGKYRALCSMGDDHRPRTQGWDTLLLAALDQTGGTGFAYGNDLLQGERLPTACVISSDIVTTLGWMCDPSLAHYCVDNVWRDLGEWAGCRHYCPDVVVEHLHYLRTGAAADGTYREAEARAEADKIAYQGWLRDGADDDVATVRGLLCQPARM